MAVESCPKCASPRVRRASDFPRHLLRVLIGSNKRFCRECGEKWHIAADSVASSSTRLSETEIILLGSVGAILFLAVANFIRDPSFKMNQLMQSYYEEKYESEGIERLRREWGWLYRYSGREQQDYRDYQRR